MNHPVVRELKRAFLVACAAIGMAGGAHAAYVEIIADPDYGPDFPGLGWRASAALYVPDACLASYVGLGSTLVQLATTPCTGAGPTDRPELQDVVVYFYASGSPATPIETIGLGTYLADAPAAIADPDLRTQELIDVTVDGDNCSGVCSSLFEVEVTALNTSRSLIFSGTNVLLGAERFFSLHFKNDIAQLIQYDQPFPAEVGRSSTATLHFGSVISDDDYRRRRLPEPGSLSLVLVSLAAALALRQRPSRARRLSR